jgi:uncharacterized surface protein with fasciclin (FAS1) repeats
MRLNYLLAVTMIAAASPLAVFAQSAAEPVAPAAAAVTPAAPSPKLTPDGDMVATLKASPDFTILTKALEATNMTGVLTSTPGLTLFAPTDQAFKALPPAELSALLDPKNVAILQKVLTYHLVHLDLDTAKFKGAKGPVQSVETANLELDGSGPIPKVNDADIIQPDVRAANSDIIQVINQVLIPPNVTLPTESAAAGSMTPSGG